MRLQPPWLARLLARQGVVAVATRTSSAEVALTFDDGPHEPLSSRLLDVLASHGVPATFFYLGSAVEAHPEVVRAAVAAGHEVGNHGWLDRPTIRLSRTALRADITRTGEAVRRVTGRTPVLFRPGSGWLTPGQLRDLTALGYRVVLGSVAVLDLTVADVDRELRFLLARVRPGSVIVLHEGGAARERVVDLVARLLPELAARGYACVPLSRLLGASTSR
ncbi:polysaccharide deacetylase family protein [Oryzobacter sp. R7]|uniref:polysaccharide deacetylase family protein n=1 Tax=Oryzobacter faecalis TaxID=3388656 RepID=UPI00398CEE8F